MTKPKGTKPKSESQKGDKRRYLREAIETLGLDAKYADAAKWVKNKYGVEVADPTFYHLRKEMQIEAGKRPQDRAAETPARGGEPTSPRAAAPQAEPPSAGITAAEGGGKERSQGGAEGTRAAAERQTAASSDASPAAPQDGVAALVLQAKGLVERLGKDEAKRLIDAV